MGTDRFWFNIGLPKEGPKEPVLVPHDDQPRERMFDPGRWSGQIAEWYPKTGKTNFQRWLDYYPMLEGIGDTLDYQIGCLVEGPGYRGYTLVLYIDTDVYDRTRDKFGVLLVAWGSCSSCDALQQCADEDDVAALAEQLHCATQWCDRAGLGEWVRAVDVETTPGLNSLEGAAFLAVCRVFADEELVTRKWPVP